VTASANSIDWGFYDADSGVQTNNTAHPELAFNTDEYWEGQIGKKMPIRAFHQWAYVAAGMDFNGWIKPIRR
jgi:hypothetical protein